MSLLVGSFVRCLEGVGSGEIGDGQIT